MRKVFGCLLFNSSSLREISSTELKKIIKEEVRIHRVEVRTNISRWTDCYPRDTRNTKNDSSHTTKKVVELLEPIKGKSRAYDKHGFLVISRQGIGLDII